VKLNKKIKAQIEKDNQTTRMTKMAKVFGHKLALTKIEMKTEAKTNKSSGQK